MEGLAIILVLCVGLPILAAVILCLTIFIFFLAMIARWTIKIFSWKLYDLKSWLRRRKEAKKTCSA